MKYSIIKNYKYKLEKTIGYTVALPDTIFHRYFGIKNGQLTIFQSFCWDGSSVPGKRFLNKITFGLYDGDRYCKEASLVHDPSCQLLQLNFLDMKYKDQIDRLYEKMCIEGATKIINAQWREDREKVLALNLSHVKRQKKLRSLNRKRFRRLKRLPAWAARRYWFVKKFGARTLNPRYYPEKVILDTKGT